MTAKGITNYLNDNFSTEYPQFHSFKENPEYLPYWNLCLKAISDEFTLNGIIFTNDILNIPPLKVFLVKYKQELVEITNDPYAKLPIFIKRSLGAFWAMVFKSCLNYTNQCVVKISMNFFFTIRTATYYVK